MGKFDAVILTDHRYIDPDISNQYNRNVLEEDGLVEEALRDKGYRTSRVSWDDPDFDWSSTRFVIFRTTWDYFERYQEFFKWLESTSKLTSMINPYETILWNLDKHYLGDLQQLGINIPPTVFIETGDRRSLKEIVDGSGWTDFILKPAIGGGAWHTYKLTMETVEEHEAVFEKLIKTESMLMQEFQHNVISEGEIAFMVFGGKYSHAILKKARDGDFRVQDDFGGSVHDYVSSPLEIEFAEKVVSSCNPVPIYARVDVIKDNKNEFCVSELELIEPELWFRNCPQAAKLFAEAFTEFTSQV
ncbi:RimK family alpha-L-glutamate ligase [Bacteroidota bacterium]